MSKKAKTNAMRILDSHKIKYNSYEFEAVGLSGLEAAEKMNEDPKKVFKTLVTVSKSGEHYVFMIPVAEELDLKKAAKSVDEKAVSMIKQAELLPLTGYVHGGCSPLGMKKQFTTVIDKSAENFDTIFYSGGRVGFQVETSLEDLRKIIPVKADDIIVK